MASFNMQIDGKYYLDFQVEVECRSGSAVGTSYLVLSRTNSTLGIFSLLC